MSETSDSTVFFDRAREGVLVVEGCSACGHRQFPPREYCLECGGTEVAWVRVSGRGRLQTFTILHRAPSTTSRERLPYAIGVVRLAEGPQLMATLAPSDGRWDLDQLVEIVPAPAPDPAPRFAAQPAPTDDQEEGLTG